MPSVSSCLISHITNYRNVPDCEFGDAFQESKEPRKIKVLIAEVGYILIVPLAVIETVFYALTRFFSRILPRKLSIHKTMHKRLESSMFAIKWALTNISLNPFSSYNLIAKEKIARGCMESGLFSQFV